jgi:hypothetical protein
MPNVILDDGLNIFFELKFRTFLLNRQLIFPHLLRTNELSGLVAHDLSGFICTYGGAYEADRIATGDSEDEI